MFKTFYTTVLPSAKNASYAPSTVFIFRQLIQPWHPSSTLVHEAALAILQLTSSSPKEFWAFSEALFEHQKDYFDVNVVNETRNATYKRLAKLGAQSVGVDEGKMFELLKVPERAEKEDQLNVGNGVTDDVKMVTKMARLIGAHVTPTVFFNGVEEKSISSSFSKEQWEEWLEKNCK